MTLATPHPQRHNAPVPFNSGSEFGDSTTSADSRLAAIFTSVCNTIGASISMAGRGGDTFGYADVLESRSANPRTAATPIASRRSMAAP